MISCIIVCVNYGDFLKLTLPLNKKLLDNIIVVTVPEDTETINACSDNGIKVLLYRCCYCPYDKDVVKDPSKLFHLGKMINQGIMYVMEHFPDNWILYLNSDIILDPDIINIDVNGLDNNNLYGSYRNLIPTKADYDGIYNNGKINFKEVYKTFVDQDGSKNVGLGFFQLFKKQVFYDQQYSNYNDNYDASHSDLLFMNKFDKVERLQDYTVLHLGMPGINWFGRKSERWI